MLGLFLFCINLSSLAILLSAQPKVGQIETFEYKQPLEQLPILDMLAGEVALKVLHAPCPKLAHFSKMPVFFRLQAVGVTCFVQQCCSPGMSPSTCSG